MYPRTYLPCVYDQPIREHFAGEPPMRPIHHFFIMGMLCVCPQVFAGTYPLGSMTCDDIGRFASEAMQWRESGLPPKEARQRLDQLKPEISVEKKNMLTVLSLVYGGYGDSWTIESAGHAMQKDCETDR
jgi:hypothetical protein